MTRSTLPLTTLQTIQRNRDGRDLVLFGAGNIAEKTLRLLSDRPRAVVDNSASLWSTVWKGFTVGEPSGLQGSAPDNVVVICTTSYVEVVEQLAAWGFEHGRDCFVSPILNDLRVIDDLEDVEARVWIASGAQPSEGDVRGGGVYQLDVSGQHQSLKKLVSGSVHSIIPRGDRYLAVEDRRGILELSPSGEVLDSHALPAGIRAHGLSHHVESDTWFLACSYADSVLRLSADFEVIQEYPLSVKAGSAEAPCHHTNDCLAVGGSLYVSMFSETGNWKRDVFDGVVMEFDIESGARIGCPIRDLWMPHNIQMIEGSLTVLDSLRGTLLRNNAQVAGQFPAFTRGLAHDGVRFYIGQSRNRNFSKALGVSNNISIDSGVVIFDEETKVSRTLQLPSTVSEIHGLTLIPRPQS